MFATLLRSFLSPRSPDRIHALQRRWSAIPESLRVADQMIGSYVWGCAATHGVHERCNFGCTACYLGSRANQQKPMPFEEIREQIDTMRRHMGPGGNIQITSGEVTLLPVEDLVRILSYARTRQLVPMVMTHGDVVLHDPAYLDRLVTEGGLTKISIHVDITQRGRKGVARTDSERELNGIRDRMAAMLRDCRKRTGRKLKAATTLTINRRNLAQLDHVVTWFLDNLDAFRILSLQPQAQTGRTHDDGGVTGGMVWRRLEEILGTRLDAHPFKFGHPDCTWLTLILAMELGRRRILLQAVRPDNRAEHRLVAELFRHLGGVDLNDQPLSVTIAKVAGLLLRHPLLLARVAACAVARSWDERRHIPAVIWAALRGRLRLRAMAFVVHNFMSGAELDTAVGRERLAACSFKVPLHGEMVSMCRMNATDLRETTYKV
ncbi:Radical SAM protein [Sulfidibacter corallicola]|uniref:Radical SAM protein n=1 Tax=Sulfidibacter corallicola TaxID=2818388 RepID=A0A8A4TW31_SULCO|nr:radical SAM protein [Sulfidibacter corallicola]QTD53344.1 radical SAM protein [Sulfidibacter corallicola]